jgi:hypothetical protein
MGVGQHLSFNAGPPKAHDTWIVFNGEIFNRADLRPDLEGHRYSSRAGACTVCWSIRSKSSSRGPAAMEIKLRVSQCRGGVRRAADCLGLYQDAPAGRVY